jgi:hypothetical protein
MFGSGANNQLAGYSPFASLSFDNWSNLLELGLTPKNVLGLGPISANLFTREKPPLEFSAFVVLL